MAKPLKKHDARVAKSRRNSALERAELRGPSTPRVFPQGATSFAIKVGDPKTREMIDNFLAMRGQA